MALYYPCSENKGTDQLRSYCEADLRLCFRIGENPIACLLQYIFSEEPGAGNIITFMQFLFIAIEGLILTTKFLTVKSVIPLK